jgi:hypothetical protein
MAHKVVLVHTTSICPASQWTGMVRVELVQMRRSSPGGQWL